MIKAVPPTQETIWFDFLLHTEFWNTPPCVDIWIDQTQIISLEIQETHWHRFKHTCVFGHHELRLIRHGKTDAETRVGSNGQYETQTLTLQDMLIDDTNIRNIVLHRCEYFPHYPEPWATQQKKQGLILEQCVPGETVFGHNGVWLFKFQSPFYKYMVDCVKGPS